MAEEEQTATAGTPSAGKPSRWHGRRWGSVAALMAILPWFGVAAILILRPGWGSPIGLLAGVGFLLSPVAVLLALVGLWRDRMRLRATLALLIGLYSIYDTISGHFQNRENIRQALAACRQAYLEQEGPNRRSYQFGWYMRTVSLCGESLTEQELLEVAGQPDFLDEAEGGRQWGYVYNQQGGLVHWIRILVKDGKTVLIEQRQDHMNHFSHLTPCKKEQTEQE